MRGGVSDFALGLVVVGVRLIDRDEEEEQEQEEAEEEVSIRIEAV